MNRLPRVIEGLVAMLLLAPGAAAAHGLAPPQETCAAAKLGATARAARAVAHCEVDAARRGVGADPACLAAAADALEAGFARAETRGTCEAQSEASVAFATTEGLVADLAAGFGSGTARDVCQAARLQAAALLATRSLLCERSAERTGTALDADCVGRAQILFDLLVHFAWASGLEAGQPHYYRVQSDTLVLEYDNTQNDTNHVHSIWRHFGRDFDHDALGKHVAESHR